MYIPESRFESALNHSSPEKFRNGVEAPEIQLLNFVKKVACFEFSYFHSALNRQKRKLES